MIMKLGQAKIDEGMTLECVEGLGDGSTLELVHVPQAADESETMMKLNVNLRYRWGRFVLSPKSLKYPVVKKKHIIPRLKQMCVLVERAGTVENLKRHVLRIAGVRRGEAPQMKTGVLELDDAAVLESIEGLHDGSTVDLECTTSAPRGRRHPDLFITLRVRVGSSMPARVCKRESCTIADVTQDRDLQKQLQPGTHIKVLCHRGAELSDSRALSEIAFQNGAEVEAIVGTHALHLQDPGTVTSLSQLIQRVHCPYPPSPVRSDSCGMQHELWCRSIDDAPPAARAVAMELVRATPRLQDTELVGEGCGTVIVIAGAGRNALRACLLGLGILDKDDEDEDEDGADSENNNIQELNDYGEGPYLIEKDWRACAFDGQPFNSEHIPEIDFGGLQDGRWDEGPPGIPDQTGNAQLRDATSIMARQLTNHFEFNFKADISDDSALIVFGGYAEDGCVVGILTYGECRAPADFRGR